jgi:hypothetical protein
MIAAARAAAFGLHMLVLAYPGRVLAMHCSYPDDVATF